MAFNLLNAVWASALPLSVAERCVLARLACATHADGIAWRSIGDLALDTGLTKRGALDIIARLTNQASPKYCIDIAELGAGTRASRYRVLRDRLRPRPKRLPRQESSGERSSPLFDGVGAVAVSPTHASGEPDVPVAVSPTHASGEPDVPVAVSPTHASGEPGSPDPCTPYRIPGIPKREAAAVGGLHAHCRPPCIRVCISKTQYAVLCGRIGGPNPAAAIDIFLEETRAALDPNRPIVGKSWDFWQRKFDEQFGATELQLSRKTRGNIHAARQFIANGRPA